MGSLPSKYYRNLTSYGHEIGKNMYAYLPPNGKWQLYMSIWLA